MRTCLLHKRPGEEGYRLKNNKNKVDGIGRASYNRKCGGEGKDSTGKTERKQIDHKWFVSLGKLLKIFH